MLEKTHTISLKNNTKIFYKYLTTKILIKTHNGHNSLESKRSYEQLQYLIESHHILSKNLYIYIYIFIYLCLFADKFVVYEPILLIPFCWKGDISRIKDLIYTILKHIQNALKNFVCLLDCVCMFIRAAEPIFLGLQMRLIDRGDCGTTCRLLFIPGFLRNEDLCRIQPRLPRASFFKVSSFKTT